MRCRNITIDDLKDKVTMKGNHFEILVATVERATEILHEEEAAAAAQSDAGVSELKRRKKCNSPQNNLNRQPAPALPPEFQCAIEEMARERETTATEAKLVIQKRLFVTDLSSGHNRLSIPRSQIADDFLTAEERVLLGGYDVESKKKKFMEVRIVEPSLAPETVKFCRWDMPKKNGGKTSSSYLINGKWNAIVARNKLRVGMVVQLWCFRIERDLCFALVRLPRN